MDGYGVVIPAFNASGTIAETLRSVAAQTVRPDLVVIVDDGSTDDLAAAIGGTDLPLQLLRQANAGPGSATTRGIAALSTPFIATLDADDLWLPTKIEDQLAYLRGLPGTSGVFCHLRNFRNDRPDAPEDAVVPGWSRTTMLIRREVAETVGPVVDPPGGRGEMIDWIARAREAGLAFDMMEEVLALRRIRPGSLSYGRDATRDRGYLEVARLAMLRRVRNKTGAG
ncbi:MULTISPECIES: glycosyltransferase family A protein [unclassified Mesorhizobium]|uniref:glycosyltransferase family 2 protein n=1 Tax=unclassified Mesorhizobium TaxID=325217 RepID=UPI0010925187|nr:MULTISPECIES: glycosyltransferase family A protein [unclassified Mesorhizobium]TGQ01889.1 glycosyltransferase family 2 protein [Mesorhizobium sp. M8A.F.Ca.ET.218.01.1.1]TGS41043.1 glycosyltransferase family 2 protein [Mesorhizobium sp. M8A.F.Ca.ET.182.01.1.1]TGS79156.1 glycosyltransferase family 2 protein [Mesorhizobium sp. M8A.F.Ca.ET.181.01.1.1]TGT21162.1 glycosyltransferase family 2 protein [Mesorhizobium sp. M8A.F.Ca.ET.213.01.1.1]TGT37552.1 glycosyltransferase family 2 protein [Mesorhi